MLLLPPPMCVVAAQTHAAAGVVSAKHAATMKGWNARPAEVLQCRPTNVTSTIVNGRRRRDVCLVGDGEKDPAPLRFLASPPHSTREPLLNSFKLRRSFVRSFVSICRMCVCVEGWINTRTHASGVFALLFPSLSISAAARTWAESRGFGCRGGRGRR